MAERAEEPGPATEADPGPASESSSAPPADRRSFLRQLSTDAVWTAGRLAGASTALRRSLVAAGESAMGTLETETPELGEPGRSVAEPVEPVEAPPPPPEQSAKSAMPDPVARLTPEQQVFLREGATATLAVNDPRGHPLLASTIYRWDGEYVHVPAREFTARTINVDRDPRVSLLIEDAASGRWVAVSGVASLLYGELVEQEMQRILAKYHDADAANRRWAELRSTGDQLVIAVRPTRFVWSAVRS